MLSADNKRNWRTQMNYLYEICPGQRAKVRNVNAPASLRQRLLDLGLVPDTVIECVGRSPGGDPSAYLIRGAVIALRRKDCGGITVWPD